MGREQLINLAYLVASILFILCLRGLSSPEQGKRGIFLGELGMFVAVVATVAKKEIISYEWIGAGLLLGSLVGTAISAKLPMTKMPERIAFSHAFGGLATALVGVGEFHRLSTAPAAVAHAAHVGELSRLTMGALGFEVFLGALTFTGSIMAFGKLQGIIPGAPVTWKGQNVMNIGAFLGAVGLLGYQIAVLQDAPSWTFYATAGVGLALGVLGVLPIGGADMPVVISLLNSYAGLAACATGFALKSNILIISGALDGSSGFILSMVMSKAMNRSFTNVIFGAFGSAPTAAGGSAGGPAKGYNEATLEDAAAVLGAASSVIVVPGYGMAVSQAQHAVRDLAAALAKTGTEVRYAIHPVAGRMPGHMNVLLAEANVPYDALYDLDMINDDFGRTDAVLVVGANDVVNPGAKTDTKSAIYGMPVFNVEQARSVIVLKRSMNTGFSGVENELFFLPNTMMVLGDAKKTLLSLASELKAPRTEASRPSLLRRAGSVISSGAMGILRSGGVAVLGILLAACSEETSSLRSSASSSGSSSGDVAEDPGAASSSGASGTTPDGGTTASSSGSSGTSSSSSGGTSTGPSGTCTAAGLAHKTGLTSLTHANGLKYNVYAPASYDKNVGHTVVILMHGQDSNGVPELNALWKPIADTDQLVLVAPTGSRAATNGSPSGANWATADLNKVLEVMETVDGCFNVFTKKHLLWGFSEGAFYGYLLGIGASTEFMGLAMGGANTSFARQNGYAPSAIGWKIPVSHVHGTQDQNPISVTYQDRTDFKAAGSVFTLHEHPGGHSISLDQVKMQWADLKGGSSP